jgi:hypothetical protein
MNSKALLVGINAYPQAPLRGCVNDISDMAQLLVRKYGFKPEDVRLLADQRATTAAILDRLRWLVDLQPGDRCFFHFSGHGAQVATRDYKQEIDGQNEIICPYEFDWSSEHMITDKTFYNFFGSVKPGVKIYWVSDSCHSGDLSRAMPNPNHVEIPRSYPMPVDMAWRNVVAKNKNISNRSCNKSLVDGKLDVAFISGCQSNQTSADTVDGSGRPCGALTHFLIDAIQKLPNNATAIDIVLKAREGLKRAGYSQIPEAEGVKSSQPFLV